MPKPVTGETGRDHALDALRAFVLLLGVAFHAAIPFVFRNDGSWAVGTADTSHVLWWFLGYAHSFRMEVFFLLAGFFAARVVGRRGTAAFLRDRAWRILTVFVILVVPMTLLASMIWIKGGLQTGWLKLPPEIAAQPVWQIAWDHLHSKPWHTLSLGHLWFLWYLACISALFVSARALLLRLGGAALMPVADRSFSRVLASPLGPLWLALPVLPWLTAMPRYDVDSPVYGLALRLPALAIFSYFFTVGWWLHRQRGLLEGLAGRWPALLTLGLFASLLVFAADWLRAHALADERVAWGGRAAVCLTMTLSALGWIGLFVARFGKPSTRLRYVAEASYWTYLMHIPVVVSLQVWLIDWDSVWLKLATINAVSLAVLLASYQLLVRHTWIGRWLGGPPRRSEAFAAASTLRP